MATPDASGDGFLGPYDPSPGPYDPSPVRSLTLELPDKLRVGTRANLRVAGNAFAGDELTAFVDPRGEECPSAADDEPKRAISLVSRDVDEGAFLIKEEYRPEGAGDRTFCAYLGPSAGIADVRASEERMVSPRRLRRLLARRTVVTALERHGFARRVVKSVQVDCDRRSPSTFRCKFADRLAGYRMRGKGKVKLGVDLSYAFRVTAQGVRFTLTDENEEPRPR